MAKSPEAEIPIPVIDNIGAPDVFADRVSGAFLTNGNVHISLVSRRCDHSKQPGVFSDVVIGRLVMPFAAAEELVRFLGDFVERMKKQIANPPIDGPKTLQ
jgi:hypothetical protein